MMTVHETTKIPASQWCDRDYGTAERALRACLSDWITSTGLDDVPTDPAEKLAHDLFTSPEGRQWISLERDEDGLPIDGELRCDEAAAASMIAEIQEWARRPQDGQG